MQKAGIIITILLIFTVGSLIWDTTFSRVHAAAVLQLSKDENLKKVVGKFKYTILLGARERTSVRGTSTYKRTESCSIRYLYIVGEKRSAFIKVIMQASSPNIDEWKVIGIVRDKILDGVEKCSF